MATVDQTPNPLVQVEPEVGEGEKLEKDVEAPVEYEFALPDFYKKLERLKER